MHGSLSLKAGAGERVLGHVLLGDSEEGAGFEWGHLQAGTLGLCPTRALIAGQGSRGN